MLAGLLTRRVTPTAIAPIETKPAQEERPQPQKPKAFNADHLTKVNPNLHGDCSNLSGDAQFVYGDATGKSGNVTGIVADLTYLPAGTNVEEQAKKNT